MIFILHTIKYNKKGNKDPDKEGLTNKEEVNININIIVIYINIYNDSCFRITYTAAQALLLYPLILYPG